MVEQSAAEIRKLLDGDVWLSTGQVAALFAVDPSTIHRWVKAKRFRFRRTVGGQRKLHPEDVRAQLAEHERVHGEEETGPGVPAG